MKTRLAFVAALLLLVVAPMSGVTYIAFEQIAVANTAIGFTTAKITPAGQVQATTAVCRVETAELRYTLDGTTPTSSVGTLLEIGDVLVVNGHDSMVVFRSIRTTAASGQLDCTYSAQ